MRWDRLPVAVRAFATRTLPKSWKPPSRKKQLLKEPRRFLVFDTETTVDHTQKLNYGAFKYFRQNAGIDRGYDCVGEGLFYADDLPQRDPAGFVQLREDVRRRFGAKAVEDPTEFRLLPRSMFVSHILFPAMMKARARVIGFNLPFDLSRIACGWGIARGNNRGDLFAGEFSFYFDEYRDVSGELQEGKYKPRIVIKSMDSKRCRIALRAPRKTRDDDASVPKQKVFRGDFVDCRTLAFTLTNEGYSLASAGRAFAIKNQKTSLEEHGVINPESIAYCRQDVQATWEVYLKLAEEFQRHSLPMPINRVVSPASIGKGYLAAMGIAPRMGLQPRFSRPILGYAMAAYYGGRAECRIRRSPVPVVYLDFLSMYPTLNVLLGNWELLIARWIEHKSDVRNVRRFLEDVTLADMFVPETWRELHVLVRVRPDDDVLPVRARYGMRNSHQIGVNRFTSERPVWYTLAEVVASKLLTGKVATVLEAVRLIPRGRQTGFTAVKLRGQVEIDPIKDDAFKRMIELRKGATQENSKTGKRLDQFLKVLANSTSYGIYAEMNPQRLNKNESRLVDVWWLDHDQVEVERPEEPGKWTFPPLAAFIAGGARLMLAVLERCVADLGGQHAFCDTDSMAIVSTKDGGLVPCPGGEQIDEQGRAAIRALSWAEVDVIRQRFKSLNPYDLPGPPKSILEVERENYDGKEDRHQLYCYAISAKRYCLFTIDEEGRPKLIKWSEHGLGHLMDPAPSTADTPDGSTARRERWMREAWEMIVCQELGIPYSDPDWLDKPAIGRFTVTGPSLAEPFRGLNEGKPYAEQVKPFNFMLIAHDASLGPDRAVLVAPFESNPDEWLGMVWTDRRTGKRYRITTERHLVEPGYLPVKTYRQVLDAYAVHPELKMAGPDGRACGPGTVGLLRRRGVSPSSITPIGKEANKLEEVENGLLNDPGQTYTAYVAQWPPTQQLLNLMPLADAIACTGLSKRATIDIRMGRSDSSADRRSRIITKTVRWAREYLKAAGAPASGLSTIEAIMAVTHRGLAAVAGDSPSRGARC